jgi:hypothetical protein
VGQLGVHLVGQQGVLLGELHLVGQQGVLLGELHLVGQLAVLPGELHLVGQLAVLLGELPLVGFGVGPCLGRPAGDLHAAAEGTSVRERTTRALPVKCRQCCQPARTVVSVANLRC